MGNAKNRKVSKKRKQSKHNTSSDQKENKPKNKKNKVTKPDPNDSIAMSKQLLLKKSNNRTNRRTSSKNELRVCANGKPIPSLAELEKMFEDSDDDEESTKSSKTCTTPTLDKQPPVGSPNSLPSPTTIAKISDKMLNYISNINPIELFEVVTPPPVILPVKRKKSDIPYIVGCNKRPRVESKPSTNFCKGDDDYGVQVSCQDQEDLPPTKRAKKSNIPNYSKSIFNAKCDEIAEGLTKADAECLSDGSTDSNKTVIYDPKQNQVDDEKDKSTDNKKFIDYDQSPSKTSNRPHSFSPLPSTSKDNATFIKNDELFNASLSENDVMINNPPAEIEKENEVQIVDSTLETIVIDDCIEEEKPALTQNTRDSFDIDGIEIIEPTTPDKHINNTDTKNNVNDCILLESTMKSEKPNNSNDETPIVIYDEYSDINDSNYSYTRDEVEIIDVDDVIAENKSIFDKWKSSKNQELDKILVVDVPATCSNSNTSKSKHPTAGNIPPTIDLSKPTATNTQPSTKPQNYTQPIAVASTAPQIPLDEPILSASPNTNQSLIRTMVSNFFKNNHTPKIDQNKTPKRRSIFDSLTIASFIDTIEKIVKITKPRKQTFTKNKCNRTKSARNFQQAVQAPPIISTQTNNVLPTPSDPPRLGDCPICLEPLSGNGIASTMCGHVFCLQCIKAAIKTNGKTCPTCRKILKGPGGGFHQLFL